VDRGGIGADDKIELHGGEARRVASASECPAVHAEHGFAMTPGSAATAHGGKRDVSRIGDMVAAAFLIGTHKVGADDPGRPARQE
jgi:hypothetical protein